MCCVPIASSVRSQLRIDTIPVRGKASTVTVLRPMLLMETRIATGAMWLLFDMVRDHVEELLSDLINL